MSLPIERWAREAVLLENRHGVTDERVLPPKRILDDIDDLSTFERQKWLGIQRNIDQSGAPQALQGIYAGLQAYPPAGAIPNVASISGEVAVWDPTKWSPVAANSVIAPQAYRVASSYQLITSTSPANGQWYPKWGTVVTGAALSAIPTSIALTASITTNWCMWGDVTIRGTGAPGAANGKVIAFCNLVGIVNAAGVGTLSVLDTRGVHQITGHTEASYDSSAASGFVWAAVHTVTTINYSVQQVHFSSWN